MEKIAPNTITVGKQAENLAYQYLHQKGLSLMQANYRCNLGEIDLIMKDQQQIVFIEVRYRKNNYFGSGAETVDSKKQRKLILTAKHYLSVKKKHHQDCRFDVISISGKICFENINWIDNAFTT